MIDLSMQVHQAHASQQCFLVFTFSFMLTFSFLLSF